MCCKIENSNLLCSQQYMKKLVFGFRRLLFDVEKGACFLVFDAPFSIECLGISFLGFRTSRSAGRAEFFTLCLGNFFPATCAHPVFFLFRVEER